MALGLLVFALFNSSDVFLLLKIKQAGGSDTEVIGVYIFYNLVYALLAYAVGIVADRLGWRRVFIGQPRSPTSLSSTTKRRQHIFKTP